MIPPFSEPSRFTRPRVAPPRSQTVGAPRLAAALAVALLAGLAACASDADPEATQRASSASTSARFVGCRPSPGECRASCPDRRFRFVDPDARCPAAGDAPNDTGACLGVQDAEGGSWTCVDENLTVEVETSTLVRGTTRHRQRGRN